MAVKGTYESFKSILITCVDAETGNPYSEDTSSLGGEPAKAFANVETVDADNAETEARAGLASDDLAIANANANANTAEDEGSEGTEHVAELGEGEQQVGEKFESEEIVTPSLNKKPPQNFPHRHD